MKIKRTSNVSTDKIYWNRATLIHLHSTGCFCARKAELNTCTERQHLKIYYLALFWKNLLTLPEMWLDNSSCEFMYRYFSLAGAGGPREATPHSRSGGAAMRRYPSSKVRSSSCALLEQLWKDTQVQGKRNPSKRVGVARGHQRADILKPYSQKTSQSNHTALSNSMKLSHAVWCHPRWTGHRGEVWQNVVHWRREWQTTSVFLPWEPHEQYEKAKW